MANLIEHVFVLMLENRAFDHMLGFSGITGLNAENGSSTKINGLGGTEANTFKCRQSNGRPSWRESGQSRHAIRRGSTWQRSKRRFVGDIPLNNRAEFVVGPSG
jgi:phospholipase C